LSQISMGCMATQCADLFRCLGQVTHISADNGHDIVIQSLIIAADYLWQTKNGVIEDQTGSAWSMRGK
ncbi:hypothetical protein KDL45_13000, partial [bacterium]|nr:hypothetical protein [bacterium]